MPTNVPGVAGSGEPVPTRQEVRAETHYQFGTRGNERMLVGSADQAGCSESLVKIENKMSDKTKYTSQ